MDKSSLFPFCIDLESTECAVGIVGIKLKDGTCGITILRGGREAIQEYVSEMQQRDDVQLALAYGETVEEVHASDSAFALAHLSKMIIDAIRQANGVRGLEEILKANNIIRN